MTEEKKALISRIKIENDQTATIEFKKTTDMDTSNVTFSGKEKVTEEFAAKFQESVNSFVEIFPALKPETQNITMNAIKFDYGSDERIEKVSYAVKYKPQTNVLANIPANSIPIYKESFTDKTFSVSGKDETLLYEILSLAQAYINGDTRTKQMTMKFDGEETNVD